MVKSRQVVKSISQVVGYNFSFKFEIPPENERLEPKNHLIEKEVVIFQTSMTLGSFIRSF